MSNLLDAPIKHLLESLYLMGIGDENGCRVNIPVQDLIDLLAEGGITVNVELESEGSGVDIYNGVNSTNNKPKIAKLDSSSLKVSKRGDGTAVVELEINNKGSAEAVDLYVFNSSQKIHEIAKVISDNLTINKDLNGEVKFRVNMQSMGGEDSISIYSYKPEYKEHQIAKVLGDNLTINKESNGEVKFRVNIQNVGSEDSIPIYSYKPEWKEHSFSKFKNSDSIIVKKDSVGNIYFEAPKSVDDSIKQYYVSESYSTDGNGSILRPYNKLTSALRDIVGNGTIVSPQFPNSIIYLLSDVTVEQWEFDQPSASKLENRLSVNSITITSADDLMRTITYKGSSSFDYPFSIKAIIDKDLQRPGANSRLSKEIRMTFNNVQLSSRTTFGVVYGVSYDGHGVADGSSPTSYLTLKKVRISTDYKKDDMNVYKQLYNAGGGAVELYGQPVLGQSTIDNNSSSMLRLEGMGNTGVGTHNLSDLSFFTSANKAISLKNTTVDLIGITTLEVDTHRLPVNSTTSNSSIKGGYAPKSGLNLIDIDSSYLRIAEYTIKGAYVSILEGNTYYFIGGYDSAFNMKHTSVNTYSLMLEKVEALVGRFNYLLKVEGTTIPDVKLKNNEWSAAYIDTMAFYQTVKGSDFLYVVVENSNIYNVKTDVVSNIQLASAKTMVNGYPYSNRISFPNDNAAMTGGLIPGNEYYNHDKRVMKRIVIGEPA